MNYPDIAGVTFEETPERLKVVLPVRRQWPYLLVYSVLMLTWLGATVWMLTLLFGVSRGDMSVRFLIVWVIILLIWAYLWYRLAVSSGAGGSISPPPRDPSREPGDTHRAPPPLAAGRHRRLRHGTREAPFITARRAGCGVRLWVAGGLFGLGLNGRPRRS